MNAASSTLIGHFALLSVISFGGTPGVLPDLRDFVVGHGWMTGQDFANCFAIVQAIPGPNMILLMSFVAWKVGGMPAAIAGALASFVPSVSIAFGAFRVWDRFRDTIWQRRVRLGLAPVTIGLIIAGGYVMAVSGNVGWASIALSVGSAALLLGTRVNPIVVIAAGGVLGACGLV